MSISKRILILSDDYGKYINALVTKKLHKLGINDYQVLDIYKPGAKFSQVIEDMEKLARHYTQQDHIFIIAGSNDFSKKTVYPSFKHLFDKIKKCSDLNLTFVHTSYGNSEYLNKRILKFNNKLSEFIQRINSCVSGVISTLSIVNKKYKNLSDMLATNICNFVTNPVKPVKNLLFVKTASDSDISAELNMRSLPVESTDHITDDVLTTNNRYQTATTEKDCSVHQGNQSENLSEKHHNLCAGSNIELNGNNDTFLGTIPVTSETET